MKGIFGSCWLHTVTFVLVVVGALNWGLVGFFEWNLVEALLGSWPVVVRVVYALVGVSGLAMLAAPWCPNCSVCKR